MPTAAAASRFVTLALTSVLVAQAVPVHALDPQPPVLVSTMQGTGQPSNGDCWSPQFSTNTRFLSFSCIGDGIIPGGGFGGYDSYLLDRATGTVERISVTNAGQQTPYDAYSAQPTDDGLTVVFAARGPLHLHYPPPYSPVGFSAVFRRDRTLNETALMSMDALGQPLRGSVQLYGVDFDRTEILFSYDGDIREGPDATHSMPSQLWIRNWHTGTVELMSGTPDGRPANGGSVQSHLSSSGRYVAFISRASDLGPAARPGDDNLYLRDRATGVVERLTFPWSGGEFQGGLLLSSSPPRTSADGRYALFTSSNIELHPDISENRGTHVYLIDRQTGEIEHISTTPGYDSYNTDPDISDDGRYVAWASRNFSFQGPPDPPADMRAIWVLDRHTGERVNVTAPLGPLYNDSRVALDLSADGSTIAFLWRIADPSPPWYRRQLLWTVQLRGTQPAGPPVPVPASSPWLLLLLGGGIVLVALAWFRRETRRRTR